MSSPQEIADRIREGEKKGLQGPMTLELYPTLKCNLDCGFCDTTERHQKPVNELSLERSLALLDEAAALGVQRVFVLGGGEPLLARDKSPATANVKLDANPAPQDMDQNTRGANGNAISRKIAMAAQVMCRLLGCHIHDHADASAAPPASGLRA